MQLKSRGEKKTLQPVAKLKPNQTKGFSKSIDTGIEINSDRFLQISLAARLVSVVLVQTYFVPDEYWQSLEIAHLKVFGYGYETWEWIEGIRASVYPLVFSILYKSLSLLHLDYAILLINTPRILQAFLSAFSDVSLFRFSSRLFGSTVGCYSYLLHLSSWFIFYTGSRTLSNTTEMALIVIGLGSYNWKIFSTGISGDNQTSSLALGLALSILSCTVRPSAAITWLPILLYEFYHDTLRKKSCYFLKYAISIGIGLFSVSTFLDYLFYDRFIVVHWRFFQFNILNNMSGFYGGHPWHWYITQGTPVIMFTHFPPLLLGITIWKENVRSKIAILSMILLQVISLSFVEHKEFRFLLPVAPLLICLAATGFYHLTHKDKEIKRKKKKLAIELPSCVINRKGCYSMILIIILNALLALYTGLVHQRGTVDVMTHLRKDLTGDERRDSVLFLMPCHSTPFYSHIHMNISMRFLGCEPHFQPGYIEEADLFYSNSTKWLHSHFSNIVMHIPSHIIAYNVLLQNSDVASFLKRRGYVETARFFHTHFPEGRVGSHVVVLSPGEKLLKVN